MHEVEAPACTLTVGERPWTMGARSRKGAVPRSLLVPVGRMVVGRAVSVAQIHPACRVQAQRQVVGVDGEHGFAGGGELLALVELDHESRVGYPEVTRGEARRPDELSDAVPAMRL